MSVVHITIPEGSYQQLLELQQHRYPFLDIPEIFKLGISQLYSGYKQNHVTKHQKIQQYLDKLIR